MKLKQIHEAIEFPEGPLPDEDEFDMDGEDWRIVRQAVLEDVFVVINEMDDNENKWYRIEFWSMFGAGAEPTREPVEVGTPEELVRVLEPYKKSIIAAGVKSCEKTINWLKLVGSGRVGSRRRRHTGFGDDTGMRLGGRTWGAPTEFITPEESTKEAQEDMERMKSGDIAFALDEILT